MADPVPEGKARQALICLQSDCKRRITPGSTQYCKVHALLFVSKTKDKSDAQDRKSSSVGKKKPPRTLKRVMDSYLRILLDDSDHSDSEGDSGKPDTIAEEPEEEAKEEASGKAANTVMKQGEPTPKASGGNSGLGWHAEASSDEEDDNIDPKIARALAKARKTALELVGTEKTYVKALKAVVNVFKRGLETYITLEKSILSQHDINYIFSSADSIYQIHYKMYQELKRLRYRCEEPSTPDALLQNVGEVLDEYLPYFRLYTKYVNSYEEAILRLQKCRAKNKELDFYISFHEVLQTTVQGVKVSIQSALITPIQRIPRYLLLLNEMIKQLDKAQWYGFSTAQKDKLYATYAKMQDVARIVNESFRLKEARDRVVQISKRLKGLEKHISSDIAHAKTVSEKVSLVMSTRYFVKDGHLEKKARNRYMNLKAYDARYVILMNDCMLYCSATKDPSKGSLDTRNILSLYRTVAAPWTLAKTTAGRSHKVIASPKASKTPGSAQAPPDSNGKHAFYHLSVKQELSNDTMIFRLHSIEERDEWVTLINLFAARTAENKLAIRNAKAKSAQNPLNPMSRKNRAALHAINKKQQEKRLSQTSLPPPEDLISDDEVVDDVSAPGETNSPGEA